MFVTSEPLDLLAPDLLRDWAEVSTAALGLSGSSGDDHLPVAWTILNPETLANAGELREQFLTFLETWPQTAGPSGTSFDDRFTVDGRHSIWWTSVGADRQTTHGIFKYFRHAALVDRAIERLAPTTILLFTKDPITATLVVSRARQSGIEVRRLPQCAEPNPDRVRVNRRWVASSCRQALESSFSALFLALRCRWSLRRARLFSGSPRPAVVFASRFERYLQIRDNQLLPLHWGEIVHAVTSVSPAVECAYLPWRVGTAVAFDNAGHERRGIAALTTIRAPLVIRECFFPVWGHGSRLLRQLVTSWRFYRLAKREEFAGSFQFAGTDMSVVVLQDLKDAVARTSEWSLRKAQVVAAFRAAGHVKAVVLAEEMYRPAMPILAAAAELGIPTVGVQHGTLMPAHLNYTLPLGHVQRAPVPDYFAVYGEYAKEVVSVHGAYPANRVWITGAARLDPLVTRPENPQTARTRLGLPADKKIVVLATQTFAWFPSAVRAVLQCMRQYPEAILCVKSHPNGRAMSIPAIEAMAAEIGTPDVRSFTGDLELLLAASDVWISSSSTTILEAALIGKRTICVNLSGDPDTFPYVEDGASLPGRSIEQLQNSLTRALDPNDDAAIDQRRRAFLTRHAGPAADGLGASTFARRLSALLRLEAERDPSASRRARGRSVSARRLRLGTY